MVKPAKLQTAIGLAIGRLLGYVAGGLTPTAAADTRGSAAGRADGLSQGCRQVHGTLTTVRNDLDTVPGRS